ncbi:ArsR family transcriptional regulator [Burkholderia sp. WAC0059]|uniref:ArsR/SmtB family transcription factor n=1 Tax=Burkholderia sp. WAC0059 TaxID=2066022 RepID=UPI000C7F1895|nr:metalloregulator ArsR/SmtB family transcription factor [Burkholderia sp. WAC0059]PLZ00227.1 ArsR family transcriptional regulator [Burkholderia sp. WAC0059]
MSDVEVNRPELMAIANYLRIMSHPSRLAIALLLLNGPCAVSEIERSLGLRQPNLSQHLGVLRDANVLLASRHAKSVIYSLCDGLANELAQSISTVMKPTAASAIAATNIPPAPSAAPRMSGVESDDASMFAHVLSRRASE